MKMDSNINETAILYQHCSIKDSIIDKKVIVGENSRITYSRLGKYVRIDRYNLIYHSHIGHYTYTGPFDMVFMAKIGNFSSISYGVTIGPPEHDHQKITTHPFLYDSKYDIFSEHEVLENKKFSKKTEIGSDVWIGCNVTILRGCKIGHGAVIGANSLVNKDIPPFSIAVGSPAKIIKYRFDELTINRLLELSWWEWNIDKIKQNKKMFLENFKQNI